MLRHRWSLLFWAAVLLLAWRLGVVQKVTPFVHTGIDAMTGQSSIDIAESAHRSTIRSTLEHAIKRYRSERDGECPKSLQALVDAGYLWSSDLQDEWGRPLQAEFRQGRLVILGLGRDGKRGTDDDWTLEN